MGQAEETLADRRAAIGAAATALRSLRAVLFQCPSAELSALAAGLAELRALAGAALVAAVAEADARGVVAESQHGSTRAWVADAAWHSRREASTIAKAAVVLARPDLVPVADALLTGDIDIPTTVAIAAEFATLEPDLRQDAIPVVLDQFVEIGATHGPAGVHRLKEILLARFGDGGRFEDHADRQRRHIHLSAARGTTAGLWDYRLTVDNEGHAVIEAVIGPLSAPRAGADTGSLDVRPVGRRRGEALITALRRSVSAAAHVPTSPKAILTVTVAIDDLREQVGSGTATGSVAAGAGLPADTLRKLACDAGILPAVLGTDGAVLSHGRLERLFTPAQIRYLWHRDRHCSFMGCDTPATWSDAHHLVHWVDGGSTDVDNGALLCGRHHTIVHRDRLAGQVVDGQVRWDRRPGSYRPRAPAAAGAFAGRPGAAAGAFARPPGAGGVFARRPGATPASPRPASPPVGSPVAEHPAGAVRRRLLGYARQ